MKILNQGWFHALVVCSILLIITAVWWSGGGNNGKPGPTAVRAAGPAGINLLTAGNFVIISKTGITNTGSHTTSITGNIGSSPITAAAMDNVFCSEIAGTIYGVDSAYTGSGATGCFAGNPPTGNKTIIDNAVLDMGTAYVDAAGRTLPDGINLYGGNLGGQTFAPGLYKFSTDVTIPTNVTLSGGANDVWIFQISGNLDIASGGSVPAGIKVILSGGAQASNVFWQVGGPIGATLGTYSTFNGTILSAKQVIIQTGAVLNGRALAQSQVTLDANTISAAAPLTMATLHVIKLVVNGGVGTATSSDFNISVKDSSLADVVGSPAPGASAPGTTYSLTAGTYTVSEALNPAYVTSFTGDCDSNGSITLQASDDKICTIVNTDIPPPAPIPAPAVSNNNVNSGGGGSSRSGRSTTPLIGIIKIPSPLVVPGLNGQVTYNYTVWNPGVTPLTNVTVTDDKCGPVVLRSGDSNSDGRLDPGENWKYTCTVLLTKTTTNTTVATGYGDILNQPAIATAIATVVVGPGLPNTGAVAPPLINIAKIPSRLTPLPYGGGGVTYSYTLTNPGIVAIHNIAVTDDKCSPVTLVSGDTNSNNMLDTSELWTYTCSTNVVTSVRNVATVKGTVNGFMALGYAFANVFVTIPTLPSTGFPPEDGRAAE